MARYTKKVRKPIRSALINLLAKVDDPKVEIRDAAMEIHSEPESYFGDDGYMQYRRTGVLEYTLHLTLYDPAAADPLAPLGNDVVQTLGDLS